MESDRWSGSDASALLSFRLAIVRLRVVSGILKEVIHHCGVLARLPLQILRYHCELCPA